MTEAEWLACEDPRDILGSGPAGDSERKSRLFAVTCCRCSPSIAANAEYGFALDVSERFAEGLASEAELRSVYEPICARALAMHEGATDEPSYRCWAECTAVAVAARLPTADASAAAWMVHRAAEHNPNERLAVLARDIFGNPFRWPLTDSTLPPVARDPAWRWLWLLLAFVSEWRTDSSVALARQMYEAREFSAMPILADALQDAGCNNDDVLAHCRGPHATHVRGCWVVDLVLGKE